MHYLAKKIRGCDFCPCCHPERKECVSPPKVPISLLIRETGKRIWGAHALKFQFHEMRLLGGERESALIKNVSGRCGDLNLERSVSRGGWGLL